MNWPYLVIMSAAIGTGVALFRLTQKPLALSGWEKLGVGLGAFCGGMIGAKLPFVLADWDGFLSGAAWLDNGKTIVSGLVGGYFGVLVTEWAMGVREKMCDSLAVPLAGAIAVGRLACFQAGCCFGRPTSLPWGVDFGDGLHRHPTQLYESVFHVTAAVVLYYFQRKRLFTGHLVRVYFVAYFCYRFLTEFLRPEPRLWLGLTGYQWAALVLIPFFALWCCPGCQPIRWSWRRKPAPQPLAGEPDCLLLKETRTLCPECLKADQEERVRPVSVGTALRGVSGDCQEAPSPGHGTPRRAVPTADDGVLPGLVYQRQGKVYLRRDCPEHGRIEALVSADRRHYYLRDEVPHGPLTPGQCCCSGPKHKTCIALLELTDACNLHCPVCYAQSPNGGHRRFEDLMADLEAFLAARGSLDILQLSGGEPLLHPELLRIIDHCRTLPIDHIMINTNGLALAYHPTLAAELARRKPRLELSIQFDGLDAQSHQVLRGADLLDRKRAVLNRVVEFDLPTTLVSTLVRDVNEDQVGPLIEIGLQTPQFRGVTFQPATWSGRYAPSADPLDRLTLADVVRLAAEQSDGLLREDDFQPLPCSNPNCCGLAVIARRRGSPLIPLNRLVHYEKHLDRLADRINFNLQDARNCCDGESRPDEFFRVVVKPFMDAYTYDQERIDECCIHIIRPGGNAVSFCRFNALER